MYESKAECRFLHSLGGDAVGMSTIPEVVAAHHADMKVLCLSLITNKVIMAGDEGSPVATHAEVLDAVEKRSLQMQTLVREIVARAKTEVLHKLPPLRHVSLAVTENTEINQQRRAKVSSRDTLLLQTVLVTCAIFCMGLAVGSMKSGR